jgi:8-amino-7-oxononanoate synthase
MPDPLDWLDDVAGDRARLGLNRSLRAFAGVSAPGRRTLQDKNLIDFSSNDYLGLAADPRVVQAAGRASEQYGWGSGASPLVSGWTEAHQALVESLARFEHAEAAALFPTGFAANIGTIVALVGPGDGIYSDRLNHASLIDGARLSGAQIRVYPHADLERLESLLHEDRSRFRRSLIVTDGLFSMDGDLAPLDRLADLAEGFGAILMVDEAHATGVLGPDGRGASSAFGVSDRVHVRVGTLSKALGSLGGFTAGSRRLVDHLLNQARTLIYSTSLPAPAVVSSTEALAILQAEPERRIALQALSAGLRERLAAEGLDNGDRGPVGPIVPILVGEPERALRVAARLLADGFLVPAIRPPSVPPGTSRLRVSLTSSHRKEDVARLVDALIDALRAG